MVQLEPSLLVAVASLVGVWLAALTRQLSKIAVLDARLDNLEKQQDEDRKLIWSFIARRGHTEAEMQGVVTRNSPLRLTDRGREAFAPVLEELVDFHGSKGRHLNDVEYVRELEYKFGEWISAEICPKFNLYMGGCLIAAMLAGKEEWKRRQGEDAGSDA